MYSEFTLIRKHLINRDLVLSLSDLSFPSIDILVPEFFKFHDCLPNIFLFTCLSSCYDYLNRVM